MVAVKSLESLGYLSNSNPHGLPIMPSYVPSMKSLKSIGSNGTLSQTTPKMNTNMRLTSNIPASNNGFNNTQPLSHPRNLDTSPTY